MVPASLFNSRLFHLGEIRENGNQLRKYVEKPARKLARAPAFPDFPSSRQRHDLCRLNFEAFRLSYSHTSTSTVYSACRQRESLGLPSFPLHLNIERTRVLDSLIGSSPSIYAVGTSDYILRHGQVSLIRCRGDTNRLSMTSFSMPSSSLALSFEAFHRTLL